MGLTFLCGNCGLELRSGGLFEKDYVLSSLPQSPPLLIALVLKLECAGESPAC